MIRTTKWLDPVQHWRSTCHGQSFICITTRYPILEMLFMLFPTFTYKERKGLYDKIIQAFLFWTSNFIPLSAFTACLKWKKRFLAAGFAIFWRRWSDQTFSESSNITKTENICTCWIFVKTKDLSKIFVKNVPSEVWIG